MPIIAWLLQVIPESIAMVTLVMRMASVEVTWKKIIKIGIIFAISIYIIRLLPFTPGVHVIVLAAVLGFISIYFGGIEMKRALIYSAITYAILVIAEFVFLSIFVNFGLFTVEEIKEVIFIRCIAGYPHTLLIFLIAFIIKKSNIRLNNFIKR